MTLWFTADTHFGHTNIIKYCNRPFASVEEMDTELIRRWNERVADDDDVWHLGDYCMGDPAKYTAQLNGKLSFIKGSHDKWMKHEPRLVELELPLSYSDNPNYPRLLVMCHYPMRSWNMSHYASWHLFGHHHGELEPYGLSFDIGVDCHNFAPVSLDEVAEKMSKLRPTVDYRK